MKARREGSAGQPERLTTYLNRLSGVAGHADRVVPLQNYTKGLFLPIERKSIEPMAARLAPGNVRQMHQSLHHIGPRRLGTTPHYCAKFATKYCPP